MRSPGAGHVDRPRLVPVLGTRAKVRVSGPPQARVAAIAALQRGRVSRRQLLLAGLSGSQNDDLLRRGLLFGVHAGVYAVGHPGAVPLGDETAALLACPDGTLLAHRSAAPLWSMREVPAPSRVEVLVANETTVRRPGIRAHRSRAFAALRPCVRDGLPVTSAPQTLLDLGLTLPRADHARAVHAALDDRIVTVAECTQVLRALPAHPAAARLGALLADPDVGMSESEFERRLSRFVRDADLPPPERQVAIGGYRLDYYWRDARFGLESDGFRFHGTRARFEADRLRDARLAALGIEVMRVTWRQLHEQPLALAASIASAIVRRTHEVSRSTG